MPVGSVIQDTDYNNIRNKVVNVLGTGSGNSGYGQASKIQSSAVVEGQQITAAQWAALRYDIYNCLVHQTGSTPTVVNVSTGSTIKYGTSFPNNAYDTLANTIISNRFDLGSGQFITESLGSRSTSDSWNAYAQLEISYTWASANAARFFFNSGGKIRVNTSFSTTSTWPQDTGWTSTCSSAGTQSFGGNASGNTSLNWFSLTNSYQRYFNYSPSGTYSQNKYELYARCDVSNNSSGTATALYIRVLLSDIYTFPNDPYDDTDQVNGTITTSSDMLLPTGVMQPAPATGNFTTSGPRSADGGSTSFGTWAVSNSSVPAYTPPPTSPTYNESVSVVPSTINSSTGGNFVGYASGGVPNTGFYVYYTTSTSTTILLDGYGTLDSSGNFSAPGTWTTPGSYRLNVLFDATGNLRSANFTVV